jgi:hypothetical protein
MVSLSINRRVKTGLAIVMVLAFTSSSWIPSEKQFKKPVIGFVHFKYWYELQDILYCEDPELNPTPRFFIYSNKKMIKRYCEDYYSPTFSYPDSNYYVFPCIKETDAFYNIQLDKGEYVYLPKDSSLQFLTWEEVLPGKHVVLFKPRNKLKQSPSRKSEDFKLASEKINLFKIQDVVHANGHIWLKVSFKNAISHQPNLETSVAYLLFNKNGKNDYFLE